MKKNNRKLHAIIIDNEQHCIDELQRGLENEERVTVLSCVSDSSRAVQEIIKHKPDLLFIDIDMPGLNGFEVLGQLRGTGLKPFVIFVTAHAQFAIEAIKHQAFDYLIKPVGPDVLRKSIDTLLENHPLMEKEDDYYPTLEKIISPHKIKLKISGGFIFLDYNDIIYIEADWNYSKIHTFKDKCDTVTLNIGTLEKQLPPGKFFRINRSCIINLAYLRRVKRLTRQCILIKNGDEFVLNIPIHKIRALERRM